MSIISKVAKYLKNVRNIALKISAIIVAVAVVVSITLLCCNSSFSRQKVEIENMYKDSILQLEENINSMADKNSELNATIKEQKTKIDGLIVQIDELNSTVETLTAEKTELEQDLEDAQAELAARRASSSTATTNTTTTEAKKEQSTQTTTAPVVSSTDLDMEYPDPNFTQATYIWNYLRGLGLNEYVCAGIMGNIMSEVGGHTLDISLYSCTESATYYGICQWSGDRKARLLNEYGRSIEAQAKFLGVELFEVIPADSEFYDMTSETDAALYFAKHFERCASWTYSVRQEDATKALNYFT